MGHLIHSVIGFIGQNAQWTFPVIFIVSFGESFVFISFFFPGTTVLIAAGALIPGGTLHLAPLLSGAIFGACLGDGISWWLGRRYGGAITNRHFFQRRAKMMQRGRDFFEEYGAGSVFVGRFFGPLRAVIPLVAGTMQMRPVPFWIANIGSALIWAPALVLPGALGEMAAHRFGIHREWIWVTIAVIVVIVAGIGWAARRYDWFGPLARRWRRK